MRQRELWLDLGLAAVLTAGSQTEIWTAHLPHPLAACLSTAVVTGGLAVRRRAPVAVGVMGLTVLCLHQLVIGDVEHASAVTVVALVVALYTLGAHGEVPYSWLVGSAGVVAFGGIAIVKDKPLGDMIFVAVVLFAPWLGGLELHRRASRVQQLQEHADVLGLQSEQRARRAVEEERARIARELHDVVAHAMSVIVVQAGAERHVLPSEQGSTRAVLETIERTGRQALVEMRRLLDMMRSNDTDLALAPQPSLANLSELCDQVRAAGLPVNVEVIGVPGPVPPGVDVSAYRIVQEALTNALKHAGPARALVRIGYGPAELAIEIVDDGRGDVTSAEPGGHGLAGMRERVAVYGGELQAGNRPSGGYAIHVRLPLAGATQR